MSRAGRMFKRRGRKTGHQKPGGRKSSSSQSKTLRLEPLEQRVFLSGEPLAVTLFEATATGFTAHFNQAVDVSALSLYDTDGGLILTQQPATGSDPTDGTISIANTSNLDQAASAVSTNEQKERNAERSSNKTDDGFVFQVGVSYGSRTNGSGYGVIENLPLSTSRAVGKLGPPSFELPVTAFSKVTGGNSWGSQGDELRKVLQATASRKASKITK